MTATAINASESRVANRGRVLIAPKGSTVPADTAAAWDAAWSDIGYTDEKGVILSKKDTHTPVMAWQTINPIRQILTARDVHFKFVLEQWNEVTLPLWTGEGAGTVVANASVSGEWKTTLSPSPAIDERMLGVEWSDDAFTVTHRLIVPRGCITDVDDIPITRTGVLAIGMTFSVLAVDTTTALLTMLMKDPAMAP